MLKATEQLIDGEIRRLHADKIGPASIAKKLKIGRRAFIVLWRGSEDGGERLIEAPIGSAAALGSF